MIPALLAMALGGTPASPMPQLHIGAVPAQALAQIAHGGCRQVAEGLALCVFASDQSGAPGLVDAAAMQAFSATPSQVWAHARKTMEGGITASRPSLEAVPGHGSGYLLSAQADGLDAAGLLYPQRLEERLGGGPVLVGCPARGALLAWRQGDAEFDQIMAVGVRRAFEGAAQPVSPSVYRWDGQGWVVWGEALPTPASSPAP